MAENKKIKYNKLCLKFLYCINKLYKYNSISKITKNEFRLNFRDSLSFFICFKNISNLTFQIGLDINKEYLYPIRIKDFIRSNGYFKLLEKC